jgi:hypothetical protein
LVHGNAVIKLGANVRHRKFRDDVSWQSTKSSQPQLLRLFC